MRRKDRQISEAEALAIADRCAWAALSMIQENNMPYCVPISIARMGNSLYFHCAKEGEKINILRANPNVCVVCVDSVRPDPEHYTVEYESAIIRGTTREITDTESKIEALRQICQRYAASHMDQFDRIIQTSLPNTGVWEIRITEITGKQNLPKPPAK